MKNRNFTKKHVIKERFKELIRESKRESKTQARNELFELRGMIKYMYFVGDIDEGTFDRLIRLTYLIRTKYKIR